MTLAVFYFAVGFVLWAGIMVSNYLKRAPREALRVHLLIAGVAIIFWPLAGVGLMFGIWNDRRAERQELARKEAAIFRVRPADLGQPITLTEIEAAERVYDPLDAVPPVPFGHLNAAWLRFCAETEGAVVRSFSAERQGYGPRPEKYIGYVAVRGEAIGSWFVTEISPG